MIRGVIFDFDGLVVDTETPAFEAWAAIYREHGAELVLRDWVECVGASYARFDPVANLERLTGRTVDRQALLADKERRKADACDLAPLMPGVRDRLEEARRLGLRTAVASSSGAAWVLHHAARTGIDGILDAVVTRDDVARIKPHPDLYLKAAERIGLPPAACLAFEDSAHGITAARAAGLAGCYAVPNRITRLMDFGHATGVLASLAAQSLATLLAAPRPAVGTVDKGG